MTKTCRISAFLLLLACSLSLSMAQTTAKKPSSGKPEKTSSSNANGATSWKQIPIPPLHQFHPQEPKRVELPNGLIVFLQEDHELPLIDGTFRIRGGSRDESADKTGLMDIYSEVWRTGGTKSKTGDQLDDELEMKAARVETFDGADSTFLSWSSLKEDFDQVLPAVLDILENPEFRQEKIDLAKQEVASFISRRNDDVNQIAQRESTRLAYGADNPYARIAEYDTVAAITRDDLVKWHKRTVAPNNMILGVTGDFDAAVMERKLRDMFGKLPQGEPFPKSQISFHDPTPGIYFIEKDDVNQSAIEIVDLGIERRNPDFYAVEVMNELFGGGFSSRLVSNIRTKEGLAYSVGGGVGAAYDHPGVLRISMGTKSGSTAAAIDALNKQIADLVNGGVKEEEIHKAKDSILNSFIFSFDSKEKVLGERMSYEFYGYPQDSLERYRAGIEKVTPEDVNRVAKKYVHPEKLAVLVVGNARDFDRDLATFGKVTPIDIRIPAPKKATENSR
ncbi:MAG: insulinase family protein [Candidatus Angelobacter sp. Gp1-AA117]|nr:MAG: insulinase family protein [Candidatus Angelobacter sp. Gp1-AA117]